MLSLSNMSVCPSIVNLLLRRYKSYVSVRGFQQCGNKNSNDS